MTYAPLTNPIDLEDWITWLNEIASSLDGKRINPIFQDVHQIFECQDATDLETAKDIVGTFLATLTNSPVNID